MAPIRSKFGGRTSKFNKSRKKFSGSRIFDPRPQEENEGREETQEEALNQISSHSPSDSDESSREEVKPYNKLLQIFNVAIDTPEPRRKRRKLERDKQDRPLDALKDEINDAENVIGSGSEEIRETQEAEQMDLDDLSGDESHSADPFEAHFANPEAEHLRSRINSSSQGRWNNTKTEFGAFGQAHVYKPQIAKHDDGSADSNFAFVPDQFMKKRLVSACQQELKSLSDIGRPLLPYIFGYHDVLFGARDIHNASSLRSLVCLHALNHVFKTRDKVLKNNSRISADGLASNIQYRDQGFTRPKVLFILPTRQSCARYVETIIAISQPEQQENRKRFEDNFGQKSSHGLADRPDDFKELFDGNDDDMFRLGVKFTRKTIKFYSQFYNSDIIIASPLGLRTAIDRGGSGKKDYDFLSSIEIVLLDQTDALLMQNWEHITYVMSHLNLSPKDAHDCDFSRVRMWYLDDQARYLRQTIVLSAYITPEINAVFNNHMANVEGKLKYQPTHDGAMLSTGLAIKQTFSRLPSPQPQGDPDARFSFFTATIVPWILRLPRPPDGAQGFLVFVPSYFDFVRLRNYFSNSLAVSSIAFGSISENSTPAEPEVRRARSHFLSGRHSVLLYSGRAHHFYRYLIKGVKKVVIYQLPDNPLFYKEIVAGFLNANISAGRMAPEEGKVRVLFSQWDALRLERIVGSERVGSMLRSGDTYDFI